MNLLDQLEFDETKQIPIEFKRPIRFTASPKTSLWQMIDVIARQTDRTRNDVIRVMLNWSVEQYFMQSQVVRRFAVQEERQDVE